ncbi:MAG: OsmC family protein [Rudaea sp.]|nr:OsmC family protein [Rudaea sp.]
MSEHVATIAWNRGDALFRGGRYSRAHEWRFDGGAKVMASASPDIVPTPWSDPGAVDPEEAFVAALSSCHMLWFLSLAAAKGFIVDSYEDEAIGHMQEIAPDKLAIAEVVLRPRVQFDPAHAADHAQVDALHHAAHERCFLANSVKTRIRVEQGGNTPESPR